MILTDEENTLLEEFGAGTLIPESKYLFPDIEISPTIDGSCFISLLLNLGINEHIDLCTVEG